VQGHVYKRGASWTYVADAGREPATGRRRQRSKVGFRTRKAAEAAMREYLHARESGQLTERTSATVGEYLEQWLANQEPTARKTTSRGYKQDLDRVIKCLGHVRLHELTPMQFGWRLRATFDDVAVGIEGGRSRRRWGAVLGHRWRVHERTCRSVAADPEPVRWLVSGLRG
jgi:hypothetical protein